LRIIYNQIILFAPIDNNNYYQYYARIITQGRAMLSRYIKTAHPFILFAFINVLLALAYHI